MKDTELFTDHVIDSDIDICFVTETWLRTFSLPLLLLDIPLKTSLERPSVLEVELE